MRFNKIFFIKLLLLTLFSLKVTTFVVDSFSKITIEKIAETSSDENESEKEQEKDIFQKIIQKPFSFLSFHQTKKKSSFRKPISIKILPVEFNTPPPEILS